MSFDLVLMSRPVESLAPLPVKPALVLIAARLDVGEGVPDVEPRHPRERPDRLAVGAPRGLDDGVRVGRGEAAVAGSDLQAGAQSLDVPLPGARQRFVEVVDVEHEVPFRRGEEPEVGQVRVTARLNGEPRGGGCCQVADHHRCRPAEKAQRRGGHPSVADWQQLRNPRPVLPGQDGERIGTGGRRRELSERRTRHYAAGSPTTVGPLGAGVGGLDLAR